MKHPLGDKNEQNMATQNDQKHTNGLNQEGEETAKI
jgi:hypothetical protein